MANHYLSIGFTTTERMDVVELLRRATSEGSSVAMLDGGRFVRLHDHTSGARVNVTVDHAGILRSAKPSFAAALPRRTTARITGLHPDPADPESDLVQLAPLGAGYPLAVEFEDGSRAISRLPFGQDVVLELVGFADALECYPHEDAYQASGVPLATKAVLPAGLVPLATAEGPARARAAALVSGVVLEVEELHNELGGGRFLHLVVETDAMEIDVVVAAGAVEGPPPRPGRIVAGSLWFVARRAEAVEVGAVAGAETAAVNAGVAAGAPVRSGRSGGITIVEGAAAPASPSAPAAPAPPATAPERQRKTRLFGGWS